jgi:hypothetical protein
MMPQVKIIGESKLVQGHVLDVSLRPLLAALRRYDPLLYFKWNPKKRAGQGVWELRRKPEFKSIHAARVVETPRGNVHIPGDVYEFDGYTICEPKYHENHIENHVKDFDRLTYGILAWVADHDLFQYGYKGKNTMSEAEYKEAKYEEKIDEDSYAEKQYMIKQHKTEFNDFREYILAGGNPARLMDYWGK